MGKFVVKDLTGMVFGRLTVTSFSHTKKHAYWNCLCECGNTKVVSSAYLLGGSTSSCGCIKKESCRKNGFKPTHNKSKTQLYHRYQIIRDRCNNPNNKKYRLYGERGINRSVPGRATAIFNDTTGFGIHVLIAFEV